MNRGPLLSPWPPLPLGIWLRRPARALPFPFGEPGWRLMAWGRHAIWHGLRALGVGSGDEVLMPAYHHGSEVEAVVRSGAAPRFYEGGRGLEPREEELEALLGSRVRAVHLTHFLGFPQDAARWRRWCDERGLLLVEDAAQAWLASRDGRRVGSHGDLSLFCLYKTFGLSEGAVLQCGAPLPVRRLDRRPGVGQLARRHAMWLASRSAAAAVAVEALRRRGDYDAERDFDLRDPGAMPWRTTMLVLRRVAEGQAAASRRANYGVLLERARRLVPPPFDRVPDGASPFAFPVAVGDKGAALERLRTSRVDALDFWSVPHPALPADRFPLAAERRAHMLLLPVHQELRPRDLERIAAALEDLAP